MILEGAQKAKGRLVIRFVDRKSFRRTKLKVIQKEIYKKLEKRRKPVILFDQESVKSREDAIEFAVKIAGSEDIVIITGKAHEKSLCFGTVEHPWSDFKAVKRAVKLRYKKD